MKRSSYGWSALAAALVLAIVSFTGCGGGDSEYGDGGPAKKKGPKPAADTAKIPVGSTFSGTVKGRVVYSGGGEPQVVMKTPTKDQEHCPSTVPAEGWYVKDSKDKKGVRYALVFVKPASGYGMPTPSPDALKLPQKDGKDVAVVVMAQPKCQFEPRVLCLHPKQKIQFINDSKVGDPKGNGISHDAKVSGNNDRSKTLTPGENGPEWDLDGNDKSPNNISCGVHQSTMSAFVWKMTHPYAVVTDAEGNFELKNVPVTEPKMILMIWHEMLNPTTKELGPLELQEKADKDLGEIKIP